jgi:hypothetical protein
MPGFVLAHVAIVFLALIVGYFGAATYSFSCFYAKQPFGSSCDSVEGMVAFLVHALSVAALLYGVWIIVVLIRRRKRT